MPTDAPQTTLTPEMLLDEIAALQRALQNAGWEIVKLRAALGVNPMHVEAPHER